VYIIISERICITQFKTKPKCIINIHAPIEYSNKTDKNEFFEKVTRINDMLPGNAIKIVIGYVSVKIGKKLIYMITTGLKSAHEKAIKRSENNSFVI